jgi:hypothetical protein
MHLIHIGFPKTGSTFLQKWFQENPHLFYAPGGLAGFHNVYQVSHLAAQNNLEAFKYYVTSDESLSTPSLSVGTIPTDRGTKTSKLRPTKQAQINGCRILKCLYPNAKILLITRGYKGATISGYSQYVRMGGAMPLPALIHLNLAHNNGKEEDNDGGAFNYGFVANEYEEAFGKENVLTLPFELMRDDQTKFLTIIEQWLHIPHFEGSKDRVNESLSKVELYWYPKLSFLVSKTAAFFGEKVYNKIYPRYVNRVFHNRFYRLIRILDILKPGRAFNEQDVSPELLAHYRRNNEVRGADRFKEDPVFLPYKSDYLID